LRDSRAYQLPATNYQLPATSYQSRPREKRDDRFEADFVLVIERIEPIGVDIQNRDELVLRVEDRHHDFRFGIRITNDVSGEFVDVRDEHRFTRRRRRAADALTELNPHAGGFALKRTEHQLTIFRKIETCPIQIRQRLDRSSVYNCWRSKLSNFISRV